MGRSLLVAFVVVPLVEVYVLLQVGHLIGTLPAIGLLLAISVAGAALVKREGARAWRRFSSAVSSGQVPAREAADGVMVLVGGTLLLTPGYVTDVVGLLLVLPPTRVLLRPALSAWLARRVLATGPLGRIGRRPGGGRTTADGAGSYGGTTIDGTVVDDDPDAG